MSDRVETKSSDGWRNNANKRRTRGLIGTELTNIFEIYDDTSVAVHLINILRSKGKIVGKRADGSPIFRDPYYMKDEETLKDIETYRNELDSNVVDPEPK